MPSPIGHSCLPVGSTSTTWRLSTSNCLPVPCGPRYSHGGSVSWYLSYRASQGQVCAVPSPLSNPFSCFFCCCCYLFIPSVLTYMCQTLSVPGTSNTRSVLTQPLLHRASNLTKEMAKIPHQVLSDACNESSAQGPRSGSIWSSLNLCARGVPCETVSPLGRRTHYDSSSQNILLSTEVP